MNIVNMRIVLLDVFLFDRRKDAELMEGQSFESEKDFMDRWKPEAHGGIEIYHMSDWMDMLNNEGYPTGQWVTYIFINQTE